MEELPQIITDLAYILIVAGMVTIVFKRLRQPLVLGYIVAGFLAGPHMPYTPSVVDHSSIEDWSQIGVIFLMFGLGLEFSFKKIVRMGMQPIIATLCVMFSMISIGSAAGYLFGWNHMDRLFLGGMLAMSSTTIIYKAFEDLGIRGQRFATGVLSTLILEDILGILLMVMLSAVAVSQRFEGMQLVSSFLQLGFFLIVCFLVGIFLVPLFFRHYKKYINVETLLIISVGLCFLLVVVAAKVGYSPAFGAFMMGSILSETMESERIEDTMTSLRNLFGAIFFVSVGMLVDPQILLQYWPSILGITLVVICGQMVFGSLSFLVSGSTLKDSMRSGFSLVQIGEFAFIIAALGESLGVTSSFLYPVVVAVSIITTFFTPYIIKLAEPAYDMLQRIIPQQLHVRGRRDKKKQKQRNQPLTVALAWKTFLTDIAVQTVAYMTLCIAFASFCMSLLLPLCGHFFGELWGNVVCMVLSVMLLSPCIRPIIMRRNNTKNARFISKQGSLHRVFYFVVVFFKFFLGTYIVFYFVQTLLPLRWYFNVPISMVLSLLIILSRVVKLLSIRLERTFTMNLRFKEIAGENAGPRYGRRLRGKDMRITALTVPLHSHWSGKTLAKLHFGRTAAIHVVAIQRGDQRINIPGPTVAIYSGDVLEIVGDEMSVESFRAAMLADVVPEGEQLLQESLLSVASFTLTESSSFINHTLADLNMRAKYNCLVIGVEDSTGHIQKTVAQRPFQAGDILWVVAEEADLSMLRMCM